MRSAGCIAILWVLGGETVDQSLVGFDQCFEGKFAKVVLETNWPNSDLLPSRFFAGLRIRTRCASDHFVVQLWVVGTICCRAPCRSWAAAMSEQSRHIALGGCPCGTALRKGALLRCCSSADGCSRGPFGGLLQCIGRLDSGLVEFHKCIYGGCELSV